MQLGFCLNLKSRAHIGLSQFEKINWLPINDRFEQFISSIEFKYFNNLDPSYLKDLFKPAGQHTINTRTSFLKLNKPLRKANHWQKTLSYVAPAIRNKLPNSLKLTAKVNTDKHSVKKHFFSDNKQYGKQNMYNYF